MKPDKVNILGNEYKIVYKENPSEVDSENRQSLLGQIDPWISEIRIYHGTNSNHDVWQSIIHEILHGICDGLHLKSLSHDDNHDELDLLALSLTDILFRNDWIAERFKPTYDDDAPRAPNT